MKDLTLNPIEQTRLHVLNSVSEHQFPATQAAELLGVSERHAWRLLAPIGGKAPPRLPTGTEEEDRATLCLTTRPTR